MCFSLPEGASLADRESSLDLIKLDISRTFPSLFIFQKVTQLFLFLFLLLRLSLCTQPSLPTCRGGPTTTFFTAFWGRTPATDLTLAT